MAHNIGQSVKRTITIKFVFFSAMSWLKLTLFLLGKLGSALCFTGMFTYCLELFPTSVRGSLVGFCNTIGRIGSMLSPLTPLLVRRFVLSIF